MRVDPNQKRRIFLGSAILLALLTATAIVFFAPTLFERLRPSIEVVALMDHAAALERESPVWIAGRPVGRVVRVTVRGAETDSAERVAVSMRVPRQYASQIRQDSEVRVTSRRLIGEPVVDILPGSPGAPAIQSKDSLRLRPGGTFRGVLQRTDALDANFQEFFADLDSFAPSADRRKGELERLDRQLSASAAGLRELLASLRTSRGRTISDVTWQRRLEQLNATSQQVSRVFNQAAERARAAHNDARPTLGRLAARSDTIASILAGMQASIAETGGGYLIRSQRDSAIVKGMHRAQAQLDSLIAETKRSPLRFWF